MRSILVLQLNRLGDLVQTVPLLRRIRREHPAARITVVALEGFCGILSECSWFDTLVAIPLEDMEALSSTQNRDAFPESPPFSIHPEFRQRYDLLINLTNDFGSSVICEKVAAVRKLGRIHTYEGELRLLGPWAKYLFSMVSHRLDNLFNLVDIQMGIAGFPPQPEPASLEVPAARRGEARALLASLGRRPGRKLVALQTGASELHRAWSLENFAAVAQGLMASGYADIALLGDAKERERAERLADLVGMPVINLAGRTSLQSLPAVLEACDLLISNDTGTIHVAAAAGTATLGLYFSTAYYSETAPYGDNHAVLQVEIPCAPCLASSRCAVQACRGYLDPVAVEEAARWLLVDVLKGASNDVLPGALKGDGGNGGHGAPRAFPNLALYRSRFLSNGSLAYLPVRADHASSHFLAGLLGRLLWEDVLGVPRDPVLEEMWRRVRASGAWEAKLAGLAGAIAGLAKPFREGLDLAVRLRAEFEADVPDRAKILPLHESLARLGASMAAGAKTAGLVGSFLQFEMMDMDYADYPALAAILEDKYRTMDGWATRFAATLGRLSG